MQQQWPVFPRALDGDDEGARECTSTGTEWKSEEIEEPEPYEMKEEDDICEKGLFIS